MKRKMVLIGAGSAQFTQGLVSDLIRDSIRQEWELGLVDIDPRALDVGRKLAEKMIKAKSVDIDVTYSTDRCDILPGADYVISSIGVGGRRASEYDVLIPRKYGIYQCLGDSVMPGGISRAMRMIPAMLDITKDIIKLCPNAHFFNYSNPMTYVCRAVRKGSAFPIVGLCHGVNNIEAYLTRFAGFNREKVSSYAVGLNHLTFFYDFRYDGKDAYPFLKEKLAEVKSKNVKYPGSSNFFDLNDIANPNVFHPFSWELFEIYNAYPAPGDAHVTEYFPERFPQGAYYGKTLGVDVFRFENYIRWGDDLFNEMQQVADSPDPIPEDFFKKFEGEHEQLLDIIYSIEHDKRIVFSVNLPNNGAVSNLPSDAVLELPAAATSKGLLPLQITDFPDTLAGIIAKHISIAEITVEGALKGDKNLFVEAVMMGGYMTDRSMIVKMVDELLDAQKQFLPQF